MKITPLPFATKQLPVARIIWLAMGMCIGFICILANNPGLLAIATAPEPGLAQSLTFIGYVISIAAIFVPIVLSLALIKVPNGALIQMLVSVSLAEAISIISLVSVLMGAAFDTVAPMLALSVALWGFRFPRET